MTRYQHTQPGTLMRISLGLALLVIAGVGAALGVNEVQATLATGAVGLLLVLCLILFHSLTVVVNPAEVIVRFGPGLIRRTIPVSRIVDIRTVRNRWYYGWGIRLTPRGWLWNVSGFDAVELQFTNGKKFRIGSNDTENLRNAIQGAIEPQP